MSDISVVSGQWGIKYKRLCATEHRHPNVSECLDCRLMSEAWSDGAMVMGKLPVPGPTNLNLSRARA